jgi:hypothetical protein
VRSDAFMRARDLISQSCSDPVLVTVLLSALETAWSKIAAHYGDDEIAAERARERLAAILLALPVREDSEPGELAETALEKMALSRR